MDRPGAQTLVMDAGRPGYAGLGVPVGGAADQRSYQLANELVGNAPGAAALELTVGGLWVTARGDLQLAAVGCGPLTLRAPGEPIRTEPGPVITLLDGCQLRIGSAGPLLRGYLAVRGGVAVPPVLGSRSTDVLTGLGPPAVVAQVWLPVGDDPAATGPRVAAGGTADPDPPPKPTAGPGSGAQPALEPPPNPVAAPPISAGPGAWAGQQDQAGVAAQPDRMAEPDPTAQAGLAADRDGEQAVVLLVTAGPAGHTLLASPPTDPSLGASTAQRSAPSAGSFPDDEAAAEPASQPRPARPPESAAESSDLLTAVLSVGWTVGMQTNRVAVRLTGAPIPISSADQQPSQPLVPGAIQLPPGGLPMVFLRDHPTTGGYPVIAVLTTDSIDRAAQLRPGQPVRFELAPPASPRSSGPVTRSI